MKKIGIDARLYFQTGVGVYIRNLLHYLQDTRLGNEYLFYIYLLDEDFDKIVFSNKNFVKRRANFRWHSISEQIGFLSLIKNDNLDLMHFTYFSYPIFYNRKFIITVHDLTPYFLKTGVSSTKGFIMYQIKHFFYRLVIRQQIEKSSVIVTPTEAVKRQIISKFGAKYNDKIVFIHEGVNYEILDNKDKNVIKKDTQKSFFIYVGNFYPHKNVESLVKAFSLSKTKADLLLIGPQDYFSGRLRRQITSLGLDDRIKFIFRANKTELIYFYKNALALIHPSLSEGFGLPIIEAAYFNLPVIASDISVFRELMGKDYTSFDPTDITDIRDKIDGFVKRQKKGINDIAARFSFAEMSRRTMGLYKQYA